MESKSNSMENTGLKILVHASAFFAPFLVPFIIYLVAHFTDNDEVKGLSIQAILFQLVMGVLITVSVVLSFILIGLPFLVVFVLMTIIIPIMGIIKSLNGETYNYPIVGRWF